MHQGCSLGVCCFLLHIKGAWHLQRRFLPGRWLFGPAYLPQASRAIHHVQAKVKLRNGNTKPRSSIDFPIQVGMWQNKGYTMINFLLVFLQSHLTMVPSLSFFLKKKSNGPLIVFVFFPLKKTEKKKKKKKKKKKNTYPTCSLSQSLQEWIPIAGLVPFRGPRKGDGDGRGLHGSA